MAKENNKMQVDVDNLKKQNVNDLLSIKELYKRIEELGEKISQIKYIDNTIVKKLKKEYENLKKTILDENVQSKLINDIETINSKLDTKITEISQDNKNINNKLNSLGNTLNIKLQEKVSFYGNGLGKKVLNAVVGNTIEYVNDPYRCCYEVLIEEKTDYFLSNCRSRNNSQAWAIVDKNDIVISCGKYEDIETGLLIKGMKNAYKLYFSMDSGSISVLYKYIDNFILYDGDKVNYDIVSSIDTPMKKSLNTIEGKNSYIINFSNSDTKNTITIPVTASNFNTIGFWVNMKFFDVLKTSKISINYLQDSKSLFTSEITQDNLRFGEWFFHKVRVDKAYTVNNIKLTVTFENSKDNVYLEISPFIVLNQFSIPTVAINFDHAWKASDDCGLYDKLINNNIPFTITGQFNCEDVTKEKLLNACANGLVDIGMYGNEEYNDGNYEIADTSTDYMAAVTNMNKCLNKKIEDGITPLSFGARGHVITPLVNNIVKNNGFKVIRNMSSGYANNSLFGNKEFLCITTRPFVTTGLDKVPLSGSCFALFAHGVSSKPSGEEKPSLYYNWADIEQVINTLITMRDDGKIKILNFKQIYEMYK